jgi:methylphosphotriester-DNA--protein-cysteine methyltransferase
MPSTNGAASKTPARKVFTVDGADLFHRKECSMVDGKDAVEITPAAARKQGLRPCPLCAPAPAQLTAT